MNSFERELADLVVKWKARGDDFRTMASALRSEASQLIEVADAADRLVGIAKERGQ